MSRPPKVDAQVALIHSVIRSGVDHHNPEDVSPTGRAFFHGMLAALGLLLDPPTQAGVLDLFVYAQKGIEFVSEYDVVAVDGAALPHWDWRLTEEESE